MPFSESVTLELSHQLQWSQDVILEGICLRGLQLYEALNASTEGFRNEVVRDVLMTHFLDYLGISLGCVGLQQAKWKNQTTGSSGQIICCS